MEKIENNKIFIFDLGGGFTDMIKDLVSIQRFTNLNKIYFTIRYATKRSSNNILYREKYNVEEIFNISSFINNIYYIKYNEISDDITNDNTYDFFHDKIKGKIFIDKNRDYLNSIYSTILEIINNYNKKYNIIGPSFWWYSGPGTIQYNTQQRINLIKYVVPSNKIHLEYLKNKNNFSEKFNCIHYRYEDDLIDNLKKWGKPYIAPPIDELISHLPFKNNYKIFICSSNIRELTKIGLLYNNIDDYDNIIQKYDNDLTFDENGFLDILLAKDCEEFYGYSYSGFSQNLNAIKKTNNNYNTLDIFKKYDKLLL